LLAQLFGYSTHRSSIAALGAEHPFTGGRRAFADAPATFRRRFASSLDECASGGRAERRRFDSTPELPAHAAATPKGAIFVSAIVVQDLQKLYGELRAVDGVSFTVDEGEIFGLLGPNGAGKTTTVEVLVGLRPRDAGEVRVLGMDPGDASAKLASRIGVQLQQVALYPRLTVLEMARLFASFYPRRLDPAETIAKVGLAEKADTQTKDLSGGQRQRLAIALTMVGDADLVFLDEPTTGLDPQARRSLWDLVLELKRRGKTILLTTHYMEEAERLCDRVAIVDHGRIIALDTPRQLVKEHFAERAIEFQSQALSRDGRLQGLAGVSRVHANGDDVVTLYTADVAAARRATLEDVFLKLAGRRIRE
jgi:ABC-2 type transport system ATP-binding protein